MNRSMLSPVRTKSNLGRKARRTLLFEPLEPKILLFSFGGTDVGGTDAEVMIVTDQLCYLAQGAALNDSNLELEDQTIALATKTVAMSPSVNNSIKISVRSDTATNRVVVEAMPAKSVDARAHVAVETVAEPTENAQVESNFVPKSVTSGIMVGTAEIEESSQQRFALVTRTVAAQSAEQSDTANDQPRVGGESRGPMVIIRVTRRASRELGASVSTPVPGDAPNEVPNNTHDDTPGSGLSDNSRRILNVVQLTTGSGSGADSEDAPVSEDTSAAEVVQSDPPQVSSPVNLSLSSSELSSKNASKDMPVPDDSAMSSDDPSVEAVTPASSWRLWLLASQSERDTANTVPIEDTSVPIGVSPPDDTSSASDAAEPNVGPTVGQLFGARALLAFSTYVPRNDSAESSPTWAEQVDATLTPGLRRIS